MNAKSGLRLWRLAQAHLVGCGALVALTLVAPPAAAQIEGLELRINAHHGADTVRKGVCLKLGEKFYVQLVQTSDGKVATPEKIIVRAQEPTRGTAMTGTEPLDPSSAEPSVGGWFVFYFPRSIGEESFTISAHNKDDDVLLARTRIRFGVWHCLNGIWHEGRRVVEVTHHGREVRAKIVEGSLSCGATPAEDFRVSIDQEGNLTEGKIAVCEPTVCAPFLEVQTDLADFSGKVSEDGQRMEVVVKLRQYREITNDDGKVVGCEKRRRRRVSEVWHRREGPDEVPDDPPWF